MTEQIRFDICPDCLAVIANGDFENVTDRIAVAEGISKWARDGYVLTYESAEVDPHFSWAPCGVCDTPLGGDRVTGIAVPLAAFGPRAASVDLSTDNNPTS